jgi:hypothetical protein
LLRKSFGSQHHRKEGKEERRIEQKEKAKKETKEKKEEIELWNPIFSES